MVDLTGHGVPKVHTISRCVSERFSVKFAFEFMALLGIVLPNLAKHCSIH